MKCFVAAILLNFILFPGFTQTSCKINHNPVLPSEDQVVYQEMEIIGFIHFTITTFYNREWGGGDEDPLRFNPYLLNAEQWVKTAKAGGAKELILTAKHHDGFCLWPSLYTEHSVKNSPYKKGKGDIVREFVDACHKYDIKAGLYLSPWDRNHKDYGKPEYITYYKNQLTELLTDYGKISEIWFDGANGGDGYYGGAREKRIIDKNYYPWAELYALVKKLQPDCMIFSEKGPDIRWVGNEDGSCGETFWSTLDSNKVFSSGSSQTYLNTGEPGGNKWLVGECDVSVRPGWFFHANENDKVKTPAQLAGIYYQSVGRNGTLLINLPPDSLGRINSIDSARFADFKSIIDETFKTNLAAGTPVRASGVWSINKCFAATNITDNNNETYWAAGEKDSSAVLEIELPQKTVFDRILLQEPIRFGQRIGEFEISAFTNNEWKVLSKATTIGYKRILKCEKTNASKIRINIIKANNTPALSSVGLFLASEKEREPKGDIIWKNESQGSFIDKRDGKIYTVVKIGTQTWLAENLTFKPGNGDFWAYDDKEENANRYGYLYFWETAKNACPPRWHLPANDEWNSLINFMGGKETAGGKLKSTTAWNAPNQGATNMSGFTALPGGNRAVDSLFHHLGNDALFWSATSKGTRSAWKIRLNYNADSVGMEPCGQWTGLSVRCIKD